MRKTLHCAVCDAALTGPLEIQSGKDPNVREPEHEDGKPLTAPGIGFKSWEPIARSYADTPGRLEFAPQFWLNPADLSDAVRLTRDRHRLNGCCGLGGCDGPNQLCRCGVEVGTLRSDCWTR